MRHRLAVPVLLALLATAARGEEAPTPAPRAPKTGARPTALPPPDGIRWERDFEAGLRRAAGEGRPLYLCVNALLDQGEPGNRMLHAEYYPAKATGDATRGMVCCVANGADHPVRTFPDGTTTCSVYGSGTCRAHRDALAWALRRFSADGESLVSPSHYLLDADLREVYRADFMQGALSVAALESWFVRLSPRLALRSVWTSREGRTDALSKVPAEQLATAAAAWVAEKDPYAAAALVAMLETESDAGRRGALLTALKGAPPDAVPVLQDAVEAATATPDADPDAASAWVDVACAVDREGLGVWAAARAVARSRDAARRRAWAARCLRDGTGPPSPRTRFLLEEAAALAGDPAGAGELLAAARAAGMPEERAVRARRAAGLRSAPPLDAADPDRRRAALVAATPEEVRAALPAVRAALADPREEIRVAAALALRRAGDGTGADVLRRAIADPVEGAEARAGLAEIAGEDRGEDPEAWEDVLRAAPGGGR